MNGYLAPVSEPHILQHIPERMHRAVPVLVAPMGRADMSVASYIPASTLDGWWAEIREIFDLPPYEAGRVGFVRLYYGIDRCWCQR